MAGRIVNRRSRVDSLASEASAVSSSQRPSSRLSDSESVGWADRPGPRAVAMGPVTSATGHDIGGSDTGGLSRRSTIDSTDSGARVGGSFVRSGSRSSTPSLGAFGRSHAIHQSGSIGSARSSVRSWAIDEFTDGAVTVIQPPEAPGDADRAAAADEEPAAHPADLGSDVIDGSAERLPAGETIRRRHSERPPLGPSLPQQQQLHQPVTSQPHRASVNAGSPPPPPLRPSVSLPASGDHLQLQLQLQPDQEAARRPAGASDNDPAVRRSVSVEESLTQPSMGLGSVAAGGAAAMSVSPRRPLQSGGPLSQTHRDGRAATGPAAGDDTHLTGFRRPKPPAKPGQLTTEGAAGRATTPKHTSSRRHRPKGVRRALIVTVPATPRLTNQHSLHVGLESPAAVTLAPGPTFVRVPVGRIPPGVWVIHAVRVALSCGLVFQRSSLRALSSTEVALHEAARSELYRRGAPPAAPSAPAPVTAAAAEADGATAAADGAAAAADGGATAAAAASAAGGRMPPPRAGQPRRAVDSRPLGVSDGGPASRARLAPAAVSRSRAWATAERAIQERRGAVSPLLLGPGWSSALRDASRQSFVMGGPTPSGDRQATCVVPRPSCPIIATSRLVRLDGHRQAAPTTMLEVAVAVEEDAMPPSPPLRTATATATGASPHPFVTLRIAAELAVDGAPVEFPDHSGDSGDCVVTGSAWRHLRGAEWQPLPGSKIARPVILTSLESHGQIAASVCVARRQSSAGPCVVVLRVPVSDAALAWERRRDAASDLSLGVSVTSDECPVLSVAVEATSLLVPEWDRRRRAEPLPERLQAAQPAEPAGPAPRRQCQSAVCLVHIGAALQPPVAAVNDPAPDTVS